MGLETTIKTKMFIASIVATTIGYNTIVSIIFTEQGP